MKVKDIINWKTINYLIDKLTYYEDIGYSTYILCRLKNAVVFRDKYTCIYIYQGNTDYFIKKDAFSNLDINDMSSFERYGLFYLISIGRKNEKDTSDLFYCDPETTKEFYENIKDKFYIISDVHHTKEILLKEK